MKTITTRRNPETGKTEYSIDGVRYYSTMTEAIIKIYEVKK